MEGGEGWGEHHETACLQAWPVASKAPWIWAHLPPTSVLYPYPQAFLPQLTCPQRDILSSLWAFVHVALCAWDSLACHLPLVHLEASLSDSNVDISSRLGWAQLSVHHAPHPRPL